MKIKPARILLHEYSGSVLILVKPAFYTTLWLIKTNKTLKSDWLSEGPT